MLRSVDGLFFKLEKFLNLIAALVILGVMLVGVSQVVGRKLADFLGDVFDKNVPDALSWIGPVPGYVDIIEMVMTIFAFIAIAYCQRLGGHVRMEIILGRLKGRVLYGLEIFGTLVALAVVLILMYFAYQHFGRAWEIGDSTIDIELPIWPSKLLVPFAFLILAIRLSLNLAGFIRLFLNPDGDEIAVPHIESVDEQAQHEIDAGLAGEEEKIDLLNRDKGGNS